MTFKINIERFNELYDQIKSSDTSYFGLGNCNLSFPFKEMSTKLHSDKEYYNIKTRIELSDSLIEKKDIQFPLFDLEKNYKIKKLNNNALIVTNHKDEHEYELIKFNSKHSNYFSIESGSSATIQKKIGKANKFAFEIDRYKSLLETLINGVYALTEKDTMNNVLYWRPDILYDDSSLFFREPEEQQQLSSMLLTEKPNVTFDDIGGNEKSKTEIEGICFALTNPELYKKWGTRPSKGILLHGPPGTGKTMLAKALANKAEADFYNIKIADVTSMWYGQSEKFAQLPYDEAKLSGKKTIIYYDELDALCCNKDSSHEASVRVLSTILMNLDGLDSVQNLMVIASTNRLDSIEPALLRPGRFDRLIEVPKPDEKARNEIFGKYLKKHEMLSERKLFLELDFALLVAKSSGYSGADISEIFRRTLEQKIRDEFDGKKVSLVSTEDMLKQISGYERNKKLKKEIGFIHS